MSEWFNSNRLNKYSGKTIEVTDAQNINDLKLNVTHLIEDILKEVDLKLIGAKRFKQTCPRCGTTMGQSERQEPTPDDSKYSRPSGDVDMCTKDNAVRTAIDACAASHAHVALKPKHVARQRIHDYYEFAIGCHNNTLSCLMQRIAYAVHCIMQRI